MKRAAKCCVARLLATVWLVAGGGCVLETTPLAPGVLGEPDAGAEAAPDEQDAPADEAWDPTAPEVAAPEAGGGHGRGKQRGRCRDDDCPRRGHHDREGEG